MLERRADVGLVGLAVMGQNLALNMADRGYRVAVYNRTTETTEKFVAEARAGGYQDSIIPARSLAELVGALSVPRRVVLMVKAGPAVDGVIDQLVPALGPGDVIADCGNSYFRDTMRRQRALAGRGLYYLGVGVSGGEEGARKGPSIMPGGPAEGWSLVEGIFREIAARAPGDGEPCVRYLGPDGAGHFVKMVHNGIEYGDMQLIAEAYGLMRDLLGLGPQDIARVFEKWNKGPLGSYLVEITAEVLGRVDAETGRPLVDVILDEAEQKGTGKWTSQESLGLGVAAPTVAEAVFARFVSALKNERQHASRLLPGPRPDGGAGMGATRDAGTAMVGTDAWPGDAQGASEAGGNWSMGNGNEDRDGDRDEAGDRPRRRRPQAHVTQGALPGARLNAQAATEDIRQALYASKICSYAQGFDLLKRASAEYGWGLDLAAVARVWRGGCIIRARFLNHVAEAMSGNTGPDNLVVADYFRRAMGSAQGGWRRVVSLAVLRGVPVPAMSSALAWYDSYRCARLPANLIQAQRDYFGAHTYRRVDRPGVFHTQWSQGS